MLNEHGDFEGERYSSGLISLEEFRAKCKKKTFDETVAFILDTLALDVLDETKRVTFEYIMSDVAKHFALITVFYLCSGNKTLALSGISGMIHDQFDQALLFNNKVGLLTLLQEGDVEGIKKMMARLLEVQDMNLKSASLDTEAASAVDELLKKAQENNGNEN
jgi:hypothetical protein